MTAGSRACRGRLEWSDDESLLLFCGLRDLVPLAHGAFREGPPA
jgi:hypothetical protein